jgi:hypothetical protein
MGISFCVCEGAHCILKCTWIEFLLISLKLLLCEVRPGPGCLGLCRDRIAASAKNRALGFALFGAGACWGLNEVLAVELI